MVSGLLVSPGLAGAGPFYGAGQGAIPPPSASVQVSATACSENQVWLRGPFGTARFSVDVADTQDSRARGLMFVENLPASHGMLFVYETPGEVAFWMKNTRIALDIIFVDEVGVVQNIAANAIPGDETPLAGEGDIQYVLEINGGMAAALGIQPGAQLQHPAISQAVWPCE